MDQLATLYRAAQFYAHAAHNFSKGATFFQDHEFLGELYGTYEEAYDSIVERMIGNGEPFSIQQILTNAAAEANRYADPSTFSQQTSFQVLLGLEQRIRASIDIQIGAQTQGTQNLLAQLADDSEMRNYKIAQRLKA